MENFSITRNGQEITLTYDEMSAAYRHLMALKGIDRLEECLDLIEDKNEYRRLKVLVKQILKDKEKCFVFEDAMNDIMEEEVNDDFYIETVEKAIRRAGKDYHGIYTTIC